MNKQLIFLKNPNLIIVLCTNLLLTACTGGSLAVVNTLARLGDYHVVSDQTYGTHKLNRLDIYIPDTLALSKPTIIFFYGGCWGACMNYTKEDYAFVAQALTAQGYVVVIPNYPRYPELLFAQIMTHAQNAVLWVDKHINQYGGTPEQIFLMGHSSGAHMAAMLTLNECYLPKQTYQHINGFIGLAGPYDFLPFTKPYQKILFGAKKNDALSQPVNYVDGTEPPMLLLYGNQDETVYPVNIENLTKKIEHSGGKVEAHRYNNIDHASILGALSIPYQKQEPILNDIVNFINKHTKRIKKKISGGNTLQ